MIIEQAGMCVSTDFLEGDPPPGLTASSLDRSYERNSSGCLDTGNNLTDFTLIIPSSPQNLSSPLKAAQAEQSSLTAEGALGYRWNNPSPLKLHGPELTCKHTQSCG